MLAHFFLDAQVLGEEAREVFPLALSVQDAKHARVLRLSVGEHIAVIDASSDYFECEIVDFSDALPLVRIAAHDDRKPREPSITLVQGLAKGDKMDTIVRHATEVGIAGFIPLVCERSVVKLDAKKATQRTQRWRSIAKSAAMQAGRRRVPKIFLPLGFDHLQTHLGGMDALLVCWEQAPETARLCDALAGVVRTAIRGDEPQVAVVVGPEGGLSEEEVSRLLSLTPHASLVSLGSTILRTETAGIVAPALVLYELGRVQEPLCGPNTPNSEVGAR